jgi:hypothetical protein
MHVSHYWGIQSIMVEIFGVYEYIKNRREFYANVQPFCTMGHFNVSRENAFFVKFLIFLTLRNLWTSLN